MEKHLNKYTDPQAFEERKLELNNGVNSRTMEFLGELSVSDYTNRSRSQKHDDLVSFYEAQEAMPRSMRQTNLEARVTMPQHFKELTDSNKIENLPWYAGKNARIDRAAAQDLTATAKTAFDNHEKMVREAYLPGTRTNELAYENALIEDKQRERDPIINALVESFSNRYENDLKDNKFSSLSNFDKVKFIQEYAHKLGKEKAVPFIKNDKGTTSILVTQYEKPLMLGIPRDWIDWSTVGRSVPEKYVVEFGKTEGDTAVIDIYDGRLRSGKDYANRRDTSGVRTMGKDINDGEDWNSDYSIWSGDFLKDNLKVAIKRAENTELVNVKDKHAGRIVVEKNGKAKVEYGLSKEGKILSFDLDEVELDKLCHYLIYGVLEGTVRDRPELSYKNVRHNYGNELPQDKEPEDSDEGMLGGGGRSLGSNIPLPLPLMGIRIANRLTGRRR